MPDKITLEQMLRTASQPSFLIKQSVYKPVIESLVNIGILKESTVKRVKRYSIIASLATVKKDDGLVLLTRLAKTNLDYNDIRRACEKIIKIAKLNLPFHGQDYVEIHYDSYEIIAPLGFSEE